MALFNPTYGTVEHEGATLAYWHQGSGPLLILISGAGGNGEIWNGVMPYLAAKYTVATFDRRGNLKSKTEHDRPVNMIQQARDVTAIIRALGFNKAYVHGNSGGGEITLQVATSYPEFVEKAIAHEAPTVPLLDDAPKWFDHCHYIYDSFVEGGPAAAWQAFSENMVGFKFDGKDIPLETGDFFFRNEFLQMSTFLPDLVRIKENGVPFGVAVGKLSGDAFYARCVPRQAKLIGCPMFYFPGYHLGFASDPAEYSRALMDAFDKIPGRKPEA